jgi:lactoylglutathione lyase
MVTATMPNLFTHDIDVAVAFYRDQLGFSESYRVPADGRPEHVVLRLGGSLLAISTPGAAVAAGLNPKGGNPLEIIVWCDDVNGETARLRRAGATVAVEPYDHPAGHRRAYVTDPDGNWLALVDAPAPS